MRTKAICSVGRRPEHGDRERQAPGQILGDPRHHLPALLGGELAHLGAEPERGDAMGAARHAILDLRAHRPPIEPPAASKNA